MNFNSKSGLTFLHPPPPPLPLTVIGEKCCWYTILNVFAVSAVIKIKNSKNKTSFVNTVGSKSLANKTGIIIMIFILVFVENCLLYDAIHDFSVWRKNGYNQSVSRPLFALKILSLLKSNNSSFVE